MASSVTSSGQGAGRFPVVPFLCLLLLCLVWGLSIPVTKLGLQSFPPLLLAAGRYLTAAPFFALLLIGRPLPSRRALLAMAGLGVVGIDIGQVTQILGVQYTEASVATVISATIPIFTVFLAGWRLRQRLRAVHLLGLAVALAGIAVVAGHGAPAAPGASGVSFTGRALAGDALMLVSSVGVAVYYALSAEATRHYPVLVVAAWSSLFGTVGLLPVIPWSLAQAPFSPSLVGIGATLYLGLLVTVAGLWVWLHSLRLLPVRIAAGTQYLQPLVGVVASAIMFGEPIGASFGIGTALVLLGIVMTATPHRLAPENSACKNNDESL